jgi:class 3 adenylate cyclase
MSSQPYLRAADDGTYELLVPFGKGSVHILPYCFHTQEDATNWLASRKGRELIRHIRPKGEKTGTYQPPLYASNKADDVISIEALVAGQAVNVAARMI